MDESPEIPAGANPRDFKQWVESEARKLETKSAKREGMEWDDVKALIGTLPPETEEERKDRATRHHEAETAIRLASFRRICPPEFFQPVENRLLTDIEAFEKCASWNGASPGILAGGPTGSSKTRACWQALGRLFVHERKSFAWFPVKRLITEFVRYESKDLAEEFYRNYRNYDILFVDDLDKFNVQFESEGAALFQFYDWVYRDHRPCLTTTNKSRQKWSDLMGDAFARRLFDDAHRPVIFK